MPQDREIAEIIAAAREHVLYLQELGVEGLSVELPAVVGRESRDVRTVEPPRLAAKSAASHPSFSKEGSGSNFVAAPVENSGVRNASVKPPAAVGGTDTPAGTRLAALPSLKKRRSPIEKIDMVKAAKADERQAASPPPVNDVPAAGEALFDIGKALPESAETMEDIWDDIGNCTRCPLFEGRTQIVQTTGNYNADLMFIGEAPGADEDAKGEPFVGRAGQLLNKIIEAIGMTRAEVAIGNINRCRPPGNRTPTLPEAHTCRPFLLREIAVIRPKVIVVLGNTALHNLLDTKVGISKVRGKFQDYYGVKVMPTFHPAYLLRDPHKKRETWEDMKMVRDYLNSLA